MISIYSIVITVAYACFLCHREAILTRLKNRFLVKFVDGLKSENRDWKQTLLMPTVLAIGLDLSIEWKYQIQLHSKGEPLWLAIPTSGFFTPISEEVWNRGIGMGYVVVLLWWFVEIKRIENQKILKYGFYLLGNLLISLAFTLGHDIRYPVQFVYFFASSMLLGLLYLYNKNLLPPIIAHAASNLFLIFRDALGGYPNIAL